MTRQARYLDQSAELDLRKLRYFLAVAHHLNFGRAAGELRLAQPALSRAIQALETDLRVALFDDPEMIALPGAHPLASRDTVSVGDLAGEPMLRYDAAPEHEAGRPSPRRGIRTMEEKLEAVALGHGVAPVPATAAAYYRRPDIVYRPDTGTQPCQVALATTTDTAQRPEAQAFIKTALAVNAATTPAGLSQA